jgi:hypothetical protein
MERKIEMEIKYFIEEKNGKRQNSIKNGIVNTKIQEKLQDTGHERTRKK